MKEKKRKILWSLTMVISLLLFGWGIGYASVSGPCVNCHTMHNSQEGAIMATGSGDYGTVGYGSLTRGTCAGCHESSGSDPLDGGYPRVKTSGASDTQQLAGGYFTTTSDASDDHGNNQHSLGATVSPAGYDTSGYVGSDWYVEANGLKCAGNSGCHGNETDTDAAKAIAGGHHANALKGLNTGYRMLQINTDAVVGSTASDYEKALNASPSADDAHNLYSATGDGSISRLCGKCHGNFHGTSNTYVGSAWVRHPSDQIIPTTWAISTVSNYDNLDWKLNPVGTADAVAPADNNMYVTCLSCHRAHGSAYADLLRFCYSDQCADGAATNGCLGCHDRQR